MAPFELQLFEQPAHRNDLAGLARVRHEGGIPVMADESIMDDASLIAVIKAEAVLPSRDSARRSTSADRQAVARVVASACHVIAYGSRRDPNN